MIILLEGQLKEWRARQNIAVPRQITSLHKNSTGKTNKYHVRWACLSRATGSKAFVQRSPGRGFSRNPWSLPRVHCFQETCKHSQNIPWFLFTSGGSHEHPLQMTWRYFNNIVICFVFWQSRKRQQEDSSFKRLKTAISRSVCCLRLSFGF